VQAFPALLRRVGSRRALWAKRAWNGDHVPLARGEVRDLAPPVMTSGPAFFDSFSSQKRDPRRHTLRSTPDGLRYDIPDRFVVSLPCGHAAGPSGAIIDADGHMLTFLSTGDEPSRRRLPPAEHISGVVAVLASFAHRTFGHWMMETLPRIELLRQAGYALEEFDGIYVTADLPVQTASLTAAGVPLTKIIDCQQRPHISADVLVVPSPLRDVAEASDLSCTFLNNVFGPREDPGGATRLYVSRRRMSRRRIINEPELLVALDRLGFVTIEPESLSLKEQAMAFAAAEVIVGPLGSALANYVYCKPGAIIAEIQNPRLAQSCSLTLAALRDLHYGMCYGNGMDSRQHPLAEDMHVDPTDVFRLLAQLGVTP
jgi:hypothetical protein